jgi:hypothetical protein
MAAEGYIKGGKPDVGWWRDQVSSAVEFRRKYAKQAKWAEWRRYYRGEWRSDVMPVNLFFSMLRATVPRVYFRNPSVSITPAIPGFLAMAFAQVLNRIDNKMLDQMQAKREIKDMVQDTFLKGTAIAKLGYGGQFTPSPLTGTEIPEGARGERFEYHSDTYANMPWLMRTDPGTFLVPDGLRRLQEARWVGHQVRRPKDDIKRDPRFTFKGDIPSTWIYTASEKGPSVQQPIEMCDLIEIRDRKYGQVFVFAPYGSKDGQVGYQAADPLQERRLPFFDLVFNPDDEVFWGVPEAAILEPIQLEANETRTQIMKHRRQTLVKILYEKGAIDEDQLANMMSEDVGAGVAVNDSIARVQALQAGTIPQELFVALQTVYQDAREAIGFSRNQLGDFQSRRGDTSATEAAIVQQGSEIRVDEKRDAVADMLVAIVEEMNEIIFDLWTTPQIIDVVGPGGLPIWVKVNPGILKSGRYTVKVDPDSAQSRSRQQREAKAIGVYNLLKTNPLIDPMKLTHYLLTELEGVELDDLMRALPPMGMNPGVVDPAQLGQIMQQQLGEAQRGGQAGLPMLRGGQ